MEQKSCDPRAHLLKLEVLKSCRATGNITPTPKHIQLNELKKIIFLMLPYSSKKKKETNRN